jgi:hypothetical protein
MAAQRTSFGKMQRDRAKKAKAAMKRERRQSHEPTTPEEPAPVIDDGGELSAPVLLELIASIHAQFDAKTITFEEFEEKKIDLLSRLPMD